MLYISDHQLETWIEFESSTCDPGKRTTRGQQGELAGLARTSQGEFTISVRIYPMSSHMRAARSSGRPSAYMCRACLSPAQNVSPKNNGVKS